MELFLAIIGLAALVIASGLAAIWGKSALDQAIEGRQYTPAPDYGPRGLIIREVDPVQRYICVCADRQTAYRLRPYGRVHTDFVDPRNGDIYWILFVPTLRDFNQVLSDVWEIAQTISPHQPALRGRGKQLLAN